MKSALLAAVSVLICANAGQAAHLSVECSNDSLHVYVALVGEFPDPSGLSAHVRARVIGSCEPAVEISPQPIPFPAFGQLAITRFTTPTIDTGRYMYLEIFGVDASGHEFGVGDSGDALQYDMAACVSDAVFGRGQVSSWGNEGTLEPCADHCWIGMPLLFLEAESGWEAYANTGMIVNVYGRAYIDGMPPGPFFMVSRLVPEADPAGCDAVGTSVVSWGALKGAYR